MASIKRVEHKSGRVVYRIVICLGYDKQGNKLVKNLTHSVNQSSTPKQQEREALKYALNMEDKIKYGHDLDAEKVSFEEFAIKWLENIKPDIEYGTYISYKHSIDKYLIPYFIGYKVANIKTPLIEMFYKSLVKDYAIGTIRKHASVLRCVFATAKRWNMIDNNPCQGAKIPKKLNEDTSLKYFTPEQALMFMKSLDLVYENEQTVPTQYKVFYALSLFCGFRKGETLALHWDDINFDIKEVSINKSLGATENGIDCKATKTATSTRTVPFPDKIKPLLKQYYSEYSQLRLSLGTAWQGNGNLFIQSEGKMMSINTPYQYFISHLNRYNQWIKDNPNKATIECLEELPVISLHGLRHSCATLLNYLNVNIVDISKYLGHANCSTTMNIYAHSFEEQKREATNKLDEFLQMNA